MPLMIWWVVGEEYCTLDTYKRKGGKGRQQQQQAAVNISTRHGRWDDEFIGCLFHLPVPSCPDPASCSLMAVFNPAAVSPFVS